MVGENSTGRYERLYILEQYCMGYMGYHENPSPEFKVFDAFFEYSPDTGECKMVYKIQKGEQIFEYFDDKLFIFKEESSDDPVELLFVSE